LLVSPKCPHSLFPNSRYDLDVCRKRHDEFFKRQFEETEEVTRARDEKRYISDLLSKFEN
jgi:hypothetical protein